MALGYVPVQYFSFPSQYHSTNAPFAFIHLSPTPHRVVDNLLLLQAWNFQWFSSVPPQEWWDAALIMPELHFPDTYYSITSTSECNSSQACTELLPRSNFAFSTTKTERCFQNYSSICPGKLHDNNVIKPKLLPFRSLPIHRSPIILPSITQSVMVQSGRCLPTLRTSRRSSKTIT